MSYFQTKPFVYFASLAVATSSICFGSVQAQAASFTATIYDPDQKVVPLTLAPHSITGGTRYDFSGNFSGIYSQVSFKGSFFDTTGFFKREGEASQSSGQLIKAQTVKLGNFSITNGSSNRIDYDDTSAIAGTGARPLISWTSPTQGSIKVDRYYVRLKGEVSQLPDSSQFNLRFQTAANLLLPFTPFKSSTSGFLSTSGSINNTPLILKDSSTRTYTFDPGGVFGGGDIASRLKNEVTISGENSLESLTGSLTQLSLYPNSTVKLTRSANLFGTEILSPSEAPLSMDEVEDLVNVFSGVPIDNASNFRFKVYATDGTQISPVPEPASVLGLMAVGGLLLSARKRFKGNSSH